MKIYLDNAATSFPKPASVTNEIMNYLTNIGGNPGRGGSTSSLEGNKVVFHARNAVCQLFNYNDAKNVIFTPNITTSLNMILQGIVTDGCHVITSAMDHNSTLRTLCNLRDTGKIELDIVPCKTNGEIDPDEFRKYIKPNTKVVTLSHGSNVTGTIQPLVEMGKICKEHNIYFVIDSAQTAGAVPVDFEELNCSALAFTGHKSLLGPQGIGGFIINDKMNEECRPIIFGGTGSLSSDTHQPDFLPDKFESGTLNTPGIAGLLAGINFIQKVSVESISEHENALTKKFLEGLLDIPTITIYGNSSCSNRTSTISVNSSIIDNSELGFLLDRSFNIITRTGLHCAPLAHKTIGTYPTGTIRFSFGYFNDMQDVDYTLNAINSIIKSKI